MTIALADIPAETNAPTSVGELLTPESGVHWCAALTKSRQEKALANYLFPEADAENRVFYYLPLTRYRQKNRTLTAVPTLPGYVFIGSLGDTYAARIAAKDSRKTLALISVSPSLQSTFRKELSIFATQNNVRAETTGSDDGPALTPGQQVQVADHHHLSGLTGTFHAEQCGRFYVRLAILGVIVSFDFSREDLIPTPVGGGGS